MHSGEQGGGLVLDDAMCIWILWWFCDAGNTEKRKDKFQWGLYSRVCTDGPAFKCYLCLKDLVRNFSYMVGILFKMRKRLSLNILVSHHVFACVTLSRKILMSVTPVKLCQQPLLASYSDTLLIRDILAFCTRFSFSWQSWKLQRTGCFIKDYRLWFTDPLTGCTHFYQTGSQLLQDSLFGPGGWCLLWVRIIAVVTVSCSEQNSPGLP